MGKSLLGINPHEANSEIDQIAIDYKLKLIAFQDGIFQSRKKLQDSDKRMADLQKKLDEYVRNKENQIAEVIFTAHMNAQRIEAQARSQTEYFILEMEEEIRRKQKEMELLQKKTSRFVNDIRPDESTEPDNIVRLQIVQNNVHALKDQVETAKTADVPLEKEEQVLPTAKTDQPLADKRQRFVVKKSGQARAKKKSAPADEVLDSIIEIKEQVPATEAAPGPVKNEDHIPSIKAAEYPVKTNDRLPATEAAEYPVKTNDRIPATEAAEGPVKNNEHVPTASQDSFPEYSRDELQPDFSPDFAYYQAANQVEPNEKMRLDAFVDARYYNMVDGHKQMEHHALQVTIEVEVPADNYSVRYTKVSSDVVSTLLNYDNVILNDIFPFNVIEPNPQNIAMYFYSCLDDMLSLMDLNLHTLTVLELPDLQIKLNTRNTKLDSFLHQGEDLLGDIRETLLPCVETEPEEVYPLKGRLNKILKRRS